VVVWPLLVLGLRWAMTRTDARVAMTAFFTLLTLIYCGAYSYKTHACDHYYYDVAFLRQARAVVPAEDPILVNYDGRPLDSHHLLFYLQKNARLIHNLTFLLDERIHDPVVYVVGRGRDEAELRKYGAPRVVLQSQWTRGDPSPLHRWTLFCLRFKEDLIRKPANLRLSPMQASGRAAGPFVE
jgi:hypothetical protein